MKGYKQVIYMSVALGMLIFAVPQLQIGGGMTLPTLFSIVWICFAILIVAANLHDILGVDEEMRAELVKVKRMRRWQTQQKLRGRTR